MKRYKSQIIRCCVCRRPNVWGGRKIAVLVQHGPFADCVLTKDHCRTCCVRRPAGEIEQERREAEAAVSLAIFGGRR